MLNDGATQSLGEFYFLREHDWRALRRTRFSTFWDALALFETEVWEIVKCVWEMLSQQTGGEKENGAWLPSQRDRSKMKWELSVQRLLAEADDERTVIRVRDFQYVSVLLS